MYCISNSKNLLWTCGYWVKFIDSLSEFLLDKHIRHSPTMDLWLLMEFSSSRSAVTSGWRLVSGGPQVDVHLPMLIMVQFGGMPLWRNDTKSWEECVTGRSAGLKDGDWDAAKVRNDVDNLLMKHSNTDEKRSTSFTLVSVVSDAPFVTPPQLRHASLDQDFQQSFKKYVNSQYGLENSP